MQKLILPIQNMLLTAGFENVAYRNRFGFSHYGHDSISVSGDRRVCAGGEGKILATGTDNVLGNVIIAFYAQVYCNTTKQTGDVILRYFHLDSIAVKQGEPVAAGTVLGIYGMTGRYSTAAHLHLEADLDTRYFAYSATVGKDGALIKAGTSKTMPNPSSVLYVGKAQSLSASKASFGGIAYVSAQELSPKL